MYRERPGFGRHLVKTTITKQAVPRMFLSQLENYRTPQSVLPRHGRVGHPWLMAITSIREALATEGEKHALSLRPEEIVLM